MKYLVRFRDSHNAEYTYALANDPQMFHRCEYRALDHLDSDWSVSQPPVPAEPELFTVATFEWGGPDYAGGHGSVIRNNSGWVCAGKSDEVLTWHEFYKNVKPGTLRGHDGQVLA